MIANQSGADPLGSIPAADAYFVLDLELPWRRDVAETPHLPQGLNDVLAAPAKRGYTVRLLGVVPDPEFSKPGLRRVIYFARPQGPFVQYEKTEYHIPEDKIVPLARALMQSMGAPAQGNESLEEFSSFRVDTSHIRDILVCTHGARDACCGKFGFDIYSKMKTQAADNPDQNIRVWRSSHLGGHRFAPTVLDLPTGSSWGYIDDAACAELALRSNSGTHMRRHYRGCSAMPTPHEQVAEGEQFHRIGWEWFSYERTTQILSRDESRDETVVQIDWRNPATDQKGSARMTIGLGDKITSPKSCGDTPEPWEQYRVVDYVENPDSLSRRLR